MAASAAPFNSLAPASFSSVYPQNELGPACSLQALLGEQIAAAQRVIAASQAISAQLGKQAGGVSSSPPSSSRGPVARLPSFTPPASPAGAPGQLRGGTPAKARCDGTLRPPLGQRQKASPLRQQSLGGGGHLGEPLLGIALGQPGQVAPQGADGNKNAILVKKTSKTVRRAETKERLMAVFPDPEAVKQQVRQVLVADTAYNVESLYHTTGFWQGLARNSLFKNTTFLVIALSSVWIAIDTDYNKTDVLTDAPWEFQAIENIFCTYFAFEIFARYTAFRKKGDAFRDGWFLFDGALSASMMFSVWLMPLLDWLGGPDSSTPSLMRHTSIFRLLRVFRLARVGRLARLLKNFPELMVLVKGMLFAMRAVFSTLCLLVLVIYIFAIAFTQMLSGTEAAQGCFENVPQSMNCLLLQGVFADQASLISKMLDAHWTYYVAVLIYMVIGSMTLLNMLIGVMCEVVALVSEAEKETILQQGLKETIAKIIVSADANHDNIITHEEFKYMLSSPDAMQALKEAKIDVVELVDFVDCIFQDKTELEMDEFVETILTFRSDNTATVKDLIDCRRHMVAELDSLMHEG